LWALTFYVATLLVELVVATVTGEPINWASRLIFLAIVAPFWAVFMDWMLGKLERGNHTP
jgi:hypothetical protein